MLVVAAGDDQLQPQHSPESPNTGDTIGKVIVLLQLSPL